MNAVFGIVLFLVCPGVVWGDFGSDQGAGRCGVCEAERAALASQLREATSEAARLRGDCAEGTAAAARLAALEASDAEQRTARAQLQKDLADAQADSATCAEERATVKKELEVVRHNFERNEISLAQQWEAATSCEHVSKVAAGKAAEAEAELRAQLAAAQAQASTCGGELDGTKAKLGTLESAATELESTSGKLRSLEDQVARATAESQACTGEMRGLQSEVTRLEALRSELQGSLDAAQATARGVELNAGEEMERLRQVVRQASQVWLPMWVIPYYDVTVAPALRFYQKEVLTGLAWERLVNATGDAYVRTRGDLEPHMQEMLSNLQRQAGPLIAKARSSLDGVHRQVQAELQKDAYRPLMVHAERVGLLVHRGASATWHELRKVFNMRNYRAGKHAVVSTVARVERDFHNLLKQLLRADVPGSGFDDEFIMTLVRTVLYVYPAIIAAFYLARACWRRLWRGAAAEEGAGVAAPGAGARGKKGKARGKGRAHKQ